VSSHRPLGKKIELLTAQTARDTLNDLVELLQDAVDSGASVGFLPPLWREVASNYWLSVFTDLRATLEARADRSTRPCSTPDSSIPP